MGSVFENGCKYWLDDRFFLVEVGNTPYEIGGVPFAGEIGSYILSFSGTEGPDGLIGQILCQDGIFGAPGCCPCFGYDKWTADELKVTDKANDEHTYCVYTHELEVSTNTPRPHRTPPHRLSQSTSRLRRTTRCLPAPTR